MTRILLTLVTIIAAVSIMLTPGPTLAQESAPAIAPSAAYIFNSLLFLLGGLFLWLAIFGLFLLRIDASSRPEPQDNFAGDIWGTLAAIPAYWITGYNLNYQDVRSFIGTFGPVDLTETVTTIDDATSYSSASDFFFQSTYACLVVALILFSISGRVPAVAKAVLGLLIAGVFYPIATSWSWGGGYLSEMGFLDFGGAAIVFVFAGSITFMLTILSGPRTRAFNIERGVVTAPPTHPGLTALSAIMLITGLSIGMGGASQLALGSVEDARGVSTIIVLMFGAGATGGFTALLLRRASTRRDPAAVLTQGVLAGCVALVAEPLAPSMAVALGIGAVAGGLQFVAARLLDRIRVDDPIGVISAGLFAGAFGVLAVSFTNGDSSLVTQLFGLAVYALAGVVSGLILNYAIVRPLAARQKR